MTRSPEIPYDTYTYKSQPGDILFFADNWAHTVYTQKGPNFMMNFRHVEALNFLDDPVNWIHAFVNTAINKPKLEKVRGKQTYKPYSDYNLKTFEKVDATCKPNFGGNSAWDEQMVALLKQVAAGM